MSSSRSTNGHSTFGRRAQEAGSPESLLALEREVGVGTRFARLDAFTGDLLGRMVRGEKVATLRREPLGATVVLEIVKGRDRSFANEHFGLDRQQARGAWFLPEEASVPVGLVNLPAYFHQHPRFAGNIAWEERGKLRLGQSSDAMVLWSLLEPIAERLFAALELRGRKAGTLSSEDAATSWQHGGAVLSSLGFSVEGELAVLRNGRDWARLNSQEQLAAKLSFLKALADQVDPAIVGARYRALETAKLVEKYYAQAKKGPALRRRALSPRPMERILSAFFGGDWLAFLDYLGEDPHPDERVATPLPGVPPVAVMTPALPERVEQGFQDAPTTIRRRVDVLLRYWQAFDALEAAQSPGQPSLWGLHQESGLGELGLGPPEGGYDPRLPQRILSGDLVREIDELWGGVVLMAWPQRIASEPLPFHLMADAFGPALTLWHGMLLTAWYVCEGPYSRTDLAGLADYHRRELATLKQMGFEPDASVFRDLAEAEQQLGPPEPIDDEMDSFEVEGVTLSFGLESGAGRRSGFEDVRDLITHHRRAWAERHLDGYLASRWQGALQRAAHSYHRHEASDGKPPTLKRFARDSAESANEWFGGNLLDLCKALGVPSPSFEPRLVLMPADSGTFVSAVFRLLGGDPEERQRLFERRRVLSASKKDQERLEKLTSVDTQRRQLAQEALRYVQLMEVTGRDPTLAEFGPAAFERLVLVLSASPDDGWQRYAEAVRTALRSAAVTPGDHSLGSVPAAAASEDVSAREEQPWWRRLLRG